MTARARSAALVLVALAALAACVQTRRVGRDEGARRDERGGEAADGGGGEAKPRREVPRPAGEPRVPAEPEALLAPGGAQRVREALAARGYVRAAPAAGDALDDAASAGLRRFQQDEGLAATGFPDRETLRRLGLEPQRVYRSKESDAAVRGEPR